MPKWLIYATIAMLIFAATFSLMPLAEKGIQPLAKGVLGDVVSKIGAENPRMEEGLAPNMILVLSSFGLVPFALILLFSKKLTQATNFKLGIFFASCCGITAGLGNLMFFKAIAAGGPVSLVVPIGALPLLPVLAGPLLFKERISKPQVAGVISALIAIILLNTSADVGNTLKEANWISAWMLYTLIALLLFGTAMTTQKAATYHISDQLSTVMYTVAYLLVSVCLIFSDKTLNWNIPPFAGGVAFLFGVLLGAGTLVFYMAYRHGKATIVTPYVMLYTLIIVLMSLPLYGDKIDAVRGAGILFAVTACLLLSIEKTSSAAAPSGTEQAADVANR